MPFYVAAIGAFIQLDRTRSLMMRDLLPPMVNSTTFLQVSGNPKARQHKELFEA